MKLRLIFFISLAILFSQSVMSQVKFEDYFENKSMRINYYFSGNSNETIVILNNIQKEKYWGGPQKNLIDPFNYGNFMIKVYDASENKLIYSRGFSSLFQEWQTTAEAKKTNKVFYQTAIIPFPKNKITFEISTRDRDNNFNVIFKEAINPDNYFITNEITKQAESEKVIGNSDPQKALDIAIIAEGYTSKEMKKFIADVERLGNFLLQNKPFDKYKDNINIWAVKAISQESGTDIPGKRVYKNTAVNSSYYTFDIERYLTTYDIKSTYDYAANVPYDQVYILINTEKYGGGGIYNYYNACTSDNSLSPEVFVHEFGHGFGGLGDEYYSSSVAYEDFYNLEVEPWEPNLTTMNDFDTKWKKMIAPGIPIPTPRISKFENRIGAFEGGGYMSKGIYSPAQDCRMKTNKSPGFCEVCQYYLEKMILFFMDESID